MGFIDNLINKIKPNGSEEKVINKQLGVEIKLPGCDKFVPIGKSQYNRVYSDDLGPRLLIIVDECGELLQPAGTKDEAGKEEDALKAEITSLMRSITQLGRSAGIHMVITTQRTDASIIPGFVQNNPVHIDTKVPIARDIK